MENKEPTLLQSLLFLAYYYTSMLLLALVYRDLFNWFVSPIIGITTIAYWQTLGILIFVEAVQTLYMKISDKAKDKKFSTVVWQSITRHILVLILWGLGALIALAL